MNVSDLKEIIRNSTFDEALCTGAETKNHIQTVLKKRNKDNFDVLYDIFLRSRTDIQEILDKKAKNRTDDDKKQLKDFKKSVALKYKSVKEMLYVESSEEKDDDGVTNNTPKKLSALVDKLSAVAQLLRYIGHTELEDALAKKGIKLQFTNLEDSSEVFANELIQKDTKDVFDRSVVIAHDIQAGEDDIKCTIFENNVPVELRYDKDINPVGIKPSDFSKLVALKQKELQSATDDGKAKLDSAVSKASSEKTYEIARAEVIRSKVIDMIPNVSDDETKEEDSLENAVDFNDR